MNAADLPAKELQMPARSSTVARTTPHYNRAVVRFIPWAEPLQPENIGPLDDIQNARRPDHGTD